MSFHRAEWKAKLKVNKASKLISVIKVLSQIECIRIYFSKYLFFWLFYQKHKTADLSVYNMNVY